MPARYLPPPRARGQAGFTLLELMIALAILALAMAVVTMSTARRSPSFETRRIALEIVGLMRDARVTAREMNEPAAVAFDADARRFAGPAGLSVELPEGIEADMVSSAAAGRPAVIFLPDGSSTGGAVTLRGGAVSERIEVDWLTSRVSRERGS